MKTLQTYAHYVIILGLVLVLVSVSQLAQGQAYWADALAQGTIPTPTPEQSAPPPSNNDNQNDDDDDNNSSRDTGSDSGGQSDSAPQQSQPAPVAVGGLLLDANDAPLSNVRVRVAEVADVEAVTNAEGQFSLNLAPGSYTLVFVSADEVELGRQPLVVDADGVTDLRITPQPVEQQAELTAAPTEADTSGGGDVPTGATETLTGTTTADTPAAAEASTQTAVTTTTTTTTTETAPAAVSSDTATSATSTDTQADTAPETLPNTGEGYVWVFTLLLGVVFVGFGLLLSRKVQVQ